MNDNEIIGLYWKRDQDAINQTSIKYGSLIRSISMRILAMISDAEENINDTYFCLWNIIPPNKPLKFPPFICKTARNLALKKYEYLSAAKRAPSAVISLSELEECVSGGEQVMDEAEKNELAHAISRFLLSCKRDAERVFIKRYFFFMTIEEISRETGMSQTKITTLLYRTRKELRQYLIKEGYDI